MTPPAAKPHPPSAPPRYDHLDVRDEAGWRRVTTASLDEFGALVDWRAVHDTNLDGVFLGCRAAIRAMRPARQGAIINIASRSGMVEGTQLWRLRGTPKTRIEKLHPPASGERPAWSQGIVRDAYIRYLTRCTLPAGSGTK